MPELVWKHRLGRLTRWEEKKKVLGDVGCGDVKGREQRKA
jgi:hypothetical protein